MKWYMYIICFVIIFLGIFSTIKLYDIFSVKSSEHGNAIVIENEDKYNEISKFDLETLSFETDNNKDYYTKYSFVNEDFDGQNKNYRLLFNGQPVDNVNIHAGKVTGIFKMSFYNLDNILVSTAEVNILIEYYTSDTRVTLTMQNTNNSVSYMTTYSNLNGAILQVIENK